MTPSETRQWLHQDEFLKVNAPSGRRVLLGLCVVIAVVGVWTLWTQTGWEERWQFRQSVDNVTDNNIWFLETSSRHTLTAREACSIESACLHNSDYTVHLLSTGNITDTDCPYHRVLSTLSNFQSEPLNASSELAATPLASAHAKGTVLGSPHSTEHLSDFLRYAVLWNRGGVYLDTDVIVLKSLSGLGNSALYEDDGVVANGILFFDKQHPVLDALMQMCSKDYDPKVWSSCGPLLMSKLLKDKLLSANMNFLEKTTFLAVPYRSWRSFFESNQTEWVMRTTNGSYGVHFWNKLSERRRVTPGSGCAMDVMAKAHCPRVYQVASLKSFF